MEICQEEGEGEVYTRNRNRGSMHAMPSLVFSDQRQCSACPALSMSRPYRCIRNREESGYQ